MADAAGDDPPIESLDDPAKPSMDGETGDASLPDPVEEKRRVLETKRQTFLDKQREMETVKNQIEDLNKAKDGELDLPGSEQDWDAKLRELTERQRDLPEEVQEARDAAAKAEDRYDLVKEMVPDTDQDEDEDEDDEE